MRSLVAKFAVAVVRGRSHPRSSSLRAAASIANLTDRPKINYMNETQARSRTPLERPVFQPISPGCRKTINGRTTAETAYYLLSAALSPDRLSEVARQHWGVENRLHWRLDVVINEDQDRTRLGNGPQNPAIMRHMALNAMQREGSKGSLRGKIKQAGWNDTFLSKLLAQF
jgi:predicted transposase YbfD/YdcC